MTAFGKEQKEARLRRLELHALEEMQVVLRTLFHCHYMPVRIRDVITMTAVWGASIGEDSRVEVDDLSEILWEDEKTPTWHPDPSERLRPKRP